MVGGVDVSVAVQICYAGDSLQPSNRLGDPPTPTSQTTTRCPVGLRRRVPPWDKSYR